MLPIIDERANRWVVRALGGRQLARVMLVGIVAAFTVTMLSAGKNPGWRQTFAVAFPAAIAASLAWAFTRGAAGSAEIDFGKRVVRVRDQEIGFGRIESLCLRTSLSVDYIRGKGPAFANWGQRWSLLLSLKGGASVVLMAQRWERTLYRAARRIAAALKVPLLDYSGVPGTVSRWLPGAVAPELGTVPVALGEWTRSSARLVVQPAAGEGAPAPKPSLRETSVAGGVTLRWRRTGSVAPLVALSAAGVASAAWFLRSPVDGHVRWEVGGALLLAAVLLVAILRRAAGGAIDSIAVGEDVLVASGRLPFGWKRRVPLSSILDIRASALLSLDLGPMGDVAREEVRVVRMDILGERGSLLQFWCLWDDGRALLEALHRLLDRGRARRMGHEQM